MINNETPRTRSLLRQAARNVEGGKLVAAEQLYRQIIEENPESVAAWLGLAEVVQDVDQKQAAYRRVLALDQDNEQAVLGLAEMRGESSSAEPAGSDGDNVELLPANKPAPMPEQASASFSSEGRNIEDHVHAYAREDDLRADSSTDVVLTCYRHPNRTTSLRCYKCNKPICSECAVKTPVGYLCPDCQREAEDAFFNAKPMDNLLALLIALPLSLLAGWLVVRFSGGFFMILLFIFAGGAVGGFIARLSKRVIGNRRGRYIPLLIAGSIVAGVVFWAWPLLIALFAGAGVIFKLAGIGVYLFTAASSAYYWAR